MALIKRIYSWTPREDGAPTPATAYVFGGYGESLAHYERLFETACQDFPELDLQKEKVACGKIHCSRDMERFSLICFTVPPGTKHAEYGLWDTEPDFHWI